MNSEWLSIRWNAKSRQLLKVADLIALFAILRLVLCFNIPGVFDLDEKNLKINKNGRFCLKQAWRCYLYFTRIAACVSTIFNAYTINCPLIHFKKRLISSKKLNIYYNRRRRVEKAFLNISSAAD